MFPILVLELGKVRRLSTEGDKSKSIEISNRLFERINDKIRKTRFSSVSEYLIYLIEKDLAETDDSPDLSKEDEEKIKQRLRSLGYL
jgi:Arc/MetJ-type ribon-helix-helix transcriptional regulator